MNKLQPNWLLGQQLLLLNRLANSLFFFSLMNWEGSCVLCSDYTILGLIMRSNILILPANVCSCTFSFCFLQQLMFTFTEFQVPFVSYYMKRVPQNGYTQLEFTLMEHTVGVQFSRCCDIVVLQTCKIENRKENQGL